MSVFRGAATPLANAYYGDQPLKKITYGDKVVWTAPVAPVVHPTLRFEKDGDLTGTLPTTYRAIPNWVPALPTSAAALPIKSVLCVKMHVEVDWTGAAGSSYYISPHNGAAAWFTAFTNAVDVGGGRSGLNMDYVIASPVVDPAGALDFTIRDRAVSAKSGYIFHDASWVEIVPLALDAHAPADLVIDKPTTANSTATAFPFTATESGGYYQSGTLLRAPAFHASGRPGGTISGTITVETTQSGVASLYLRDLLGNPFATASNVTLTAGTPYIWNYSFPANTAKFADGVADFPAILVGGTGLVDATVTLKAGATMKYTAP